MPEPEKLPLEDSLQEKELFASEIVGIVGVHGNFIVTLANLRLEEPIRNQPPKMKRVVVGRLVLTNVAASQMLANLQNIAAQIEAAAKTAAGHKPN